MNAILAFEAHFSRGPDGIYTDSVHDYRYWQRFLRVFDSVVIVARVSERAEKSSVRSDGPGVRFAPLPWYQGPQEFARCLPAALRHVRRIVDANPDSAFIIRGPGGVATLLWQELWRRRLPYGLQVVADAWETLRGTSSIGHHIRPAVAVLQWLQVRRACAVTYATRASLQSRYPPRDGVFHLSVSDVELPDALFDCAPVQIRGCSAGLRLAFVGSLHQRYKGLDLLLRAVASTGDRITIAGDGPFRPEYEGLAAQLGLSDRVRFVGSVPGGAPVFEMLRQHDVFVLPSRAEGLPRAMLEAMAVGLPCVGTRVGGIPEILDRDDTVPPDDVAALAAKLTEMADPARRATAAHRNRLVAAQYRVSLRDERLHRFYRHVREHRSACATISRHGMRPA